MKKFIIGGLCAITCGVVALVTILTLNVNVKAEGLGGDNYKMNLMSNSLSPEEREAENLYNSFVSAKEIYEEYKNSSDSCLRASANQSYYKAKGLANSYNSYIKEHNLPKSEIIF